MAEQDKGVQNCTTFAQFRALVVHFSGGASECPRKLTASYGECTKSLAEGQKTIRMVAPVKGKLYLYRKDI